MILHTYEAASVCARLQYTLVGSPTRLVRSACFALESPRRGKPPAPRRSDSSARLVDWTLARYALRRRPLQRG
jgi:hypothetical protein